MPRYAEHPSRRAVYSRGETSDNRQAIGIYRLADVPRPTPSKGHG
jgi:hypothetical protein